MKKTFVVMLIVVSLTMMVTYAAGAAVPNPGVKFGTWIKDNVAGLMTGVLAIIGLFLIIKRQLMMAITVLIFAGLASVFIFGGTTFAQTLQSIVQSWF